MGSLTGTLLSGVGLTFLQEVLRSNAKDWSQAVANLFGHGSGITIDLVPMSQVLFGLILILLMIFRPAGLLGTSELRLTKLFSRRGPK
jgi:ABC-type branched-subunit amino acid transport system permease subunit